MTSDGLDQDLPRFMEAVSREPGSFPINMEASLANGALGYPIPHSLLQLHPTGKTHIWLESETAGWFRGILGKMEDEASEGELEHLTGREIRDLLWNLVCEVWLKRDENPPGGFAEWGARFLADIRRAPQRWEVFWRIQNLLVSDRIAIGQVEVLPRFLLVQEQLICEDDSRFWGLTEQSSDFAFARSEVLAGTREKAAERGAQVIDDALNLLRLALSQHRFLRSDERRFARDEQYVIRNVSSPGERRVAWQSNRYSVDLHLRQESLQIAREGVEGLAVAFTDSVSAGVRVPFMRAVQWAGSAVMRTDWDDRIVDLCTALECLFTEKNDRQKAASIAARYMLAGLAINEDSYATHPLRLYELYGLRNDIVHGADRRVAEKSNCDELEYVVHDSLHRISTLIAANPAFQRPLDLFRFFQSPDNLATTLKFVRQFDGTGPAATNVSRLLRRWSTANTSTEG